MSELNAIKNESKVRFSKELLLGIDIGTSGCKACIYTTEGDIVAHQALEHEILTGARGVAEENPLTWWESVKQILRNILKQIPVGGNILGIGISCTNAVVIVNKEGEPLSNAIMQLDGRMYYMVERMLQHVPHSVFQSITGNRVTAGTVSAPTILWLMENSPTIFHKPCFFLSPAGFIGMKLTGEFVVDYSRAATTALFNIRNHAWSEEILEKVGIDAKILPTLAPSQKIIGLVNRRAAHETGLKAGIPVVAGSMDTVAAAIGLGSILPEHPFLILGTIGRIGLVHFNDELDARFMNCPFPAPKRYLTQAPINGAGISLRWYRELFGKNKRKWQSSAETFFRRIDREARTVPAGSKGLIYLPYLMGERSPHWDPYARGVLLGLSIRHTQKDILRAILEGVGYSIRNNKLLLEQSQNITFSQIRIAGGGTKSRIWCQILSDILGVKLLLTRNSDTETLGAAILAGLGVGVYKDLEDGTGRAVKISGTIEPDEKCSGTYKDLYAVYDGLYDKLSFYFKVLSAY